MLYELIDHYVRLNLNILISLEITVLALCVQNDELFFFVCQLTAFE